MAKDQTLNTAETRPAHEIHIKAAEHCVDAYVAHIAAAKLCELGYANQAKYHAVIAQSHEMAASNHSEIAFQKTVGAAKDQKNKSKAIEESIKTEDEFLTHRKASKLSKKNGEIFGLIQAVAMKKKRQEIDMDGRC